MSEQTKGQTWAETPFFDKEFDLYQDGKNGYAVSADGVQFYTATEVTASNGWVKVELGEKEAIKSAIAAAAYQTGVIGALTYHCRMVYLPEALHWEKSHNEYVANPTDETAARLVLAANAWRERIFKANTPIIGETAEQSADPEFRAQRDSLLFGDTLRNGTFTLELDNIGEVGEEENDVQ